MRVLFEPSSIRSSEGIRHNKSTFNWPRLTWPAWALRHDPSPLLAVHSGDGAGIIGTALALVLSLSVVPAQKAADFFSSAILRLYARDRMTLGVFTLLSCAALISLPFGTGWTFSLSPRYSLAGQLVLIGVSLDALRVFYNRALNLLDPATALSLLSSECELHLTRTSNVERLVRVHESAGGGDGGIARYVLHTRSNLCAALNDWTTQLEEFAHKGVTRRDTQAVSAIVRTMAQIGEKYCDVRRDRLFLLPDFSGRCQ